MKICILQTAFTNSHAIEEHSLPYDQGNFTDQHEFHHVWIHTSTAKEQIDDVVARDYNFYFNFMWGQHQDDISGIDACKYFESFNLPSIGQRSEVLERSKNDFYADARQLGSLRIPGTSNYLLFVKAAQSCGSQYISAKSLCHNREELVEALANLEKELAPGRAVASQLKKANAVLSTTVSIDGIIIPEDVVVQEYVSGWDYSIVVIEVGDCPVPLLPARLVYPAGFTPYEDFLTFDTKFHPETHVRPMRYQDDPVTFTKLQEAAVQAFHANRMEGQAWCNVDIRVPRPGEGEPTVIEVNPMPALFLPPDHEWEDIVIREGFPGGHRALINTLIASHLQWRRTREQVQSPVADVYDQISSKYDEIVHTKTHMTSLYQKVLTSVDPSHGSILELGPGTGLFGRALAQSLQSATPPKSGSSSPADDAPKSLLFSRTSTISGIEISNNMAEICEQTGVYDKIHRGSIQAILLTIGSFDHIASFSVLYFLSPEDFTMIMVRSFQLARKSLIVHIDEIPEDYIEKLVEMGPPHSHMIGYNHLKDMERMFCNPPPAGWKLGTKFRQSAWNSPVAMHNTDQRARILTLNSNTPTQKGPNTKPFYLFNTEPKFH